MKSAKNSEEEFAARKKAIAGIERESQQKTGLRSDVVTLYQGGEYWLYRYKKYTDVRLVFAPEQQVAFFGGDPDNFTYPRYDLDMALFRVYENGKPIKSANYLKWNAKGAADGDLVFVSGHPGSTQRLDTMAQLETERDLVLPTELKLLRHRIEVLRKYAATGPEHARQADSLIFGLENSVKAIDGEYKGLQDKNVMDTKRTDEQKFQSDRDDEFRVARQVRQRLGRDRGGRAKSGVAIEGAVLSQHRFAARRFCADHRPVRRRDQEAGWRAPAGFPRSPTRIAAIPVLFARADLSRHGDRAHHRRAPVGPSGDGRGRSFLEDRAGK